MTLLTLTGRISATLVAASLAAAPLAQADRGGRSGHDHHYVHLDGDYGDAWRYERRGKGHKHRDRYYDDHGYKRPYKRPVVIYAPPVYYAPPRRVVTYSYGYSYGPHYFRGYKPRWEIGHFYEYVPRRTVYITDYDRYGLYAPPRGYHWVRDDDRGDAILASVATGAIIGLVVGALATH